MDKKSIGYRRSMKLTALVVTLVFTATSVTWATPATAAMADSEVPASSSLSQLVIPAEMGTITSKFGVGNQEVGEKGKLQTPNSARRTVILIQDAHAVIDAQENIRKILGHLRRHYGVSLTALEGAKGRLEPILIRSFPDPAVKRKVLAGYENRAELSGPEMAAVLQDESGEFRGMEDWKLYERNYGAYLAAQEKEDMLLARWNSAMQKLDQARSKIYSAQLNEFHEARENFLADRTSLLDLLIYLSNFKGLLKVHDSGLERNRYREDLLSEGRRNDMTDQGEPYTDLPALINSIGYEKAGKQEALAPLVRKVADEFKTKYLRELGVKTEMNFYNRYQAFMTGQITAGQMLQFLVQLGNEHGKVVKLSPELKKLLGHTEILSDIKGSVLFDELQRFLEVVESSLVKTAAQRELAGQYQKLYLLKDLITLELTQEGLSKYEKEPLHGPVFEGLEKDLVPALEFYKYAEARDRAFMGKIDAMMKDSSQKTVVVVAGGFHTNGLKGILKEKGIGYAVITPKISSLAGVENYPKVMKGEVSFRDYLKTTCFDALMRHAAKAFVDAMPISDRVRTLKLWRDNVIRELAREDRIAEAGKFLPYIDELLAVAGEAVTVNRKRTKEEILDIVSKELGKFKKDSFEKLWRTFELQLDLFTDGLKQLIAKKDLSVQSVSELLGRSSQAQPSALQSKWTMGLDPNIPAQSSGLPEIAHVSAGLLAGRTDEAIFGDTLLSFQPPREDGHPTASRQELRKEENVVEARGGDFFGQFRSGFLGETFPEGELFSGNVLGVKDRGGFRRVFNLAQKPEKRELKGVRGKDIGKVLSYDGRILEVGYPTRFSRIFDLSRKDGEEELSWIAGQAAKVSQWVKVVLGWYSPFQKLQQQQPAKYSNVSPYAYKAILGEGVFSTDLYDDRILLALYENNFMRAFDLDRQSGRQEILKGKLNEGVLAYSFGEVGDGLLWVSFNTGSERVFDLRRGAWKQDFSDIVGEGTRSIEIYDSRIFVVRYLDESVRVFDLELLSQNRSLIDRMGEGAFLGLRLLSYIAVQNPNANIADMEKIYQELLPRIQLFSKYTKSYNRYLVGDLLERHLTTSNKLDMDLFFRHLDFSLQILEKEPFLGFRILESIFEGIDKRVISQELPEREKEKVLGFVELTRSFNLSFYEVYKQLGEAGVQEALKTKSRILDDSMNVRAKADFVKEWTRKGFNGEALLFAVQQAAVPTSGSSFETREGVFNLWEHIEALQRELQGTEADFQTRVPESLRRLDRFGGGAIEEIERKLPEGENYIPGNRIQFILNAFKYFSTGQGGATVPADRAHARVEWVKKLEALFRDFGNPALREEAFQSFLAYVRYDTELAQAVAQVQNDYIGLEVLGSLFENRDSRLNVLLREVLREEFVEHEDIKDPKKQLRILEGIWKNNEKTRKEKETGVRNVLKRFPREAIREKLLTAGALPVDLTEFIRSVSEERSKPGVNPEALMEALFGPVLKNIEEDKNKFRETVSGQLVRLKFRAVGPMMWGPNAGVCIQDDFPLMKNKNFFLLEMIDETTEQAAGFAHLFVVEHNGKKYLTVPGINPSLEFLGKVKAREVYPMIKEALIKLGEAGGFDAVLIPAEWYILSNRKDIIKLVAAEKLKKLKSFGPVSWNTVPKPYPFSDPYILWQRSGSSPKSVQETRAELRQAERLGTASALQASPAKSELRLAPVEPSTTRLAKPADSPAWPVGRLAGLPASSIRTEMRAITSGQTPSVVLSVPSVTYVDSDVQTVDLRDQALEILKTSGEPGSESYETVKTAIEVSFEAHQRDPRKFTFVQVMPYMRHVVGAVKTLMNEFEVRDSNTVAVMFLHDVKEDHPDVWGKREAFFNPVVRRGVNVLTKKWQPEESTEKEEDDYLQRVFETGTTGEILAKLSDRTNNLRGVLHNLREGVAAKDPGLPTVVQFAERQFRQTEAFFIPRVIASEMLSRDQKRKFYQNVLNAIAGVQSLNLETLTLGSLKEMLEAQMTSAGAAVHASAEIRRRAELRVEELPVTVTESFKALRTARFTQFADVAALLSALSSRQFSGEIVQSLIPYDVVEFIKDELGFMETADSSWRSDAVQKLLFGQIEHADALKKSFPAYLLDLIHYVWFEDGNLRGRVRSQEEREQTIRQLTERFAQETGEASVTSLAQAVVAQEQKMAPKVSSPKISLGEFITEFLAQLPVGPWKDRWLREIEQKVSKLLGPEEIEISYEVMGKQYKYTYRVDFDPVYRQMGITFTFDHTTQWIPMPKLTKAIRVSQGMNLYLYADGQVFLGSDFSHLDGSNILLNGKIIERSSKGPVVFTQLKKLSGAIASIDKIPGIDRWRQAVIAEHEAKKFEVYRRQFQEALGQVARSGAFKKGRYDVVTAGNSRFEIGIDLKGGRIMVRTFDKATYDRNPRNAVPDMIVFWEQFCIEASLSVGANLENEVAVNDSGIRDSQFYFMIKRDARESGQVEDNLYAFDFDHEGPRAVYHKGDQAITLPTYAEDGQSSLLANVSQVLHSRSSAERRRFLNPSEVKKRSPILQFLQRIKLLAPDTPEANQRPVRRVFKNPDGRDSAMTALRGTRLRSEVRHLALRNTFPPFQTLFVIVNLALASMSSQAASKDSRERGVREKLRQLELLSDTDPAGDLGPKIMEFQISVGLPADGIWGTNTDAAFASVTRPAGVAGPKEAVAGNEALQAGPIGAGCRVVRSMVVQKQLAPDTAEATNFIYTYIFQTSRIVQRAKQNLTDEQFERLFRSSKKDMTSERVFRLARFIFNLNNHESGGHVHIRNKLSSAFSQAQILKGTRREILKNPLLQKITGDETPIPANEAAWDKFPWEEFMVTGPSSNRNRIAMIPVFFLRADRNLTFDQLFPDDPVEQARVWGKWYHTQSPKKGMQDFSNRAKKFKSTVRAAEQFYRQQFHPKAQAGKGARRSEVRGGLTSHEIWTEFVAALNQKLASEFGYQLEDPDKVILERDMNFHLLGIASERVDLKTLQNGVTELLGSSGKIYVGDERWEDLSQVLNEIRTLSVRLDPGERLSRIKGDAVGDLLSALFQKIRSAKAVQNQFAGTSASRAEVRLAGAMPEFGVRGSNLPKSLPKDFVVLSPIFNEEGLVLLVTEQSQRQGYPAVYIDDGSEDGTAEKLQLSGAYFVSFTKNAKKEGALKNTLQFLKGKYGSLPEYVVTVDGDSYLVATGTASVGEALVAAIQQMRVGQKVARPIDIAARLTTASGLVEWVQGVKWFLMIQLRSFYSNILRVSPGLVGSGVIFKTQILMEALEQMKTGFEAGDVELSNLISAKGKVDRPLSTVQVKTRVFKIWEEFLKQQKRWARAQLEGSPRWFVFAMAGGLMLFDGIILLNLPVFLGLMFLIAIQAGTSWLIREAVFALPEILRGTLAQEKEMSVQWFRDVFFLLPLLVIFETFDVVYYFNLATVREILNLATRSNLYTRFRGTSRAELRSEEGENQEPETVSGGPMVTREEFLRFAGGFVALVATGMIWKAGGESPAAQPALDLERYAPEPQTAAQPEFDAVAFRSDLISQASLYFTPEYGIDPVSATPYDHLDPSGAPQHYTQLTAIGFQLHHFGNVLLGTATSAMSRDEVIGLSHKTLDTLFFMQSRAGDHGLMPAWWNMTGNSGSPLTPSPNTAGTMAFIDNANLTANLLVFAALLRKVGLDDPEVNGLYTRALQFVDNQKSGYRNCVKDGSFIIEKNFPVDGSNRGLWTHSRLGTEVRSAIALLAVYFDLPDTVFTNLQGTEDEINGKPNTITSTMMNKKTTQLKILPVDGAFQHFWNLLILPEQEFTKGIAENLWNYFVLNADHMARTDLPGFSSASMVPGALSEEYAGNQGLNFVRPKTKSQAEWHTVHRDNIGSLYSLASAYVLNPQYVVKLLSGILTNFPEYGSLFGSYDAADSRSQIAGSHLAVDAGSFLLGLTGSGPQAMKEFLVEEGKWPRMQQLYGTLSKYKVKSFTKKENSLPQPPTLRPKYDILNDKFQEGSIEYTAYETDSFGTRIHYVELYSHAIRGHFWRLRAGNDLRGGQIALDLYEPDPKMRVGKIQVELKNSRGEIVESKQFKNVISVKNGHFVLSVPNEPQFADVRIVTLLISRDKPIRSSKQGDFWVRCFQLIPRAEVRGIGEGPLFMDLSANEKIRQIQSVFGVSAVTAQAILAAVESTHTPEAIRKAFNPQNVLDSYRRAFSMNRMELAEALVKHPGLVTYNPERFVEECRKNLGFTQNQAAGLVRRSPSNLGRDVSRNLAPKLRIIREQLSEPAESEIALLNTLAPFNLDLLQMILETAVESHYPVQEVRELRKLYTELNNSAKERFGETAVQMLRVPKGRIKDRQALEAMRAQNRDQKLKPLLRTILDADSRAEVRLKKNIKEGPVSDPFDGLNGKIVVDSKNFGNPETQKRLKEGSVVRLKRFSKDLDGSAEAVPFLDEFFIVISSDPKTGEVVLSRDYQRHKSHFYAREAGAESKVSIISELILYPEQQLVELLDRSGVLSRNDWMNGRSRSKEADLADMRTHLHHFSMGHVIREISGNGARFRLQEQPLLKPRGRAEARAGLTESSQYAKRVAELFEKGLDETDNAIGVHGTSIEAIQWLAEHGKLPDTGRLPGEFYFFPLHQTGLDAMDAAMGYAEWNSLKRYVSGKIAEKTSISLTTDQYEQLSAYVNDGESLSGRDYALLARFCRENNISEKELDQWIREARRRRSKGVLLLLSKEVLKDGFIVQDGDPAEGEKRISAPGGLHLKYILGIEPQGQFEWEQLERLQSEVSQELRAEARADTSGLTASMILGMMETYADAWSKLVAPYSKLEPIQKMLVMKKPLESFYALNYVLRLWLLKTMGVLKPEARVFNVLSGADWFAGLFVREMWVVDKVAGEASLRSLFLQGYSKLKNSLPERERDVLLPPESLLAEIRESRTDVLDRSFVSSWTSHMKAGDVILMKFIPEYLTIYGASREQVKDWLDRFMQQVPEGVYVVVATTEDSSVKKVFPEGMEAYFRKNAAFQDVLPKLLSAEDYALFQKMNQNPALSELVPLRASETSPTRIGLGGQWHVFKKVVSEKPLPEPAQAPGESRAEIRMGGLLSVVPAEIVEIAMRKAPEAVGLDLEMQGRAELRKMTSEFDVKSLELMTDLTKRAELRDYVLNRDFTLVLQEKFGAFGDVAALSQNIFAAIMMPTGFAMESVDPAIARIVPKGLQALDATLDKVEGNLTIAMDPSLEGLVAQFLGISSEKTSHVNEVAVTGALEGGIRNQLRKRGISVRTVSPKDQNFTPRNDQSAVPYVTGVGATANILSEVFDPLMGDVASTGDVFVRDYMSRLMVVAAIHLADIRAHRRVRGEAMSVSEIRDELLRRLNLFEQKALIQVQGRGFMISSVAVQAYLRMQAEKSIQSAA